MTAGPGAFRALAIDLDGTLLDGDDIPPANIDAVAAARDAGLQIIIATARWLQMAERTAAKLGTHGLAIACSGAQVHDPHAGRDIFDHRLPAEFVDALYALCNAERCIATITVNDHVQLKLDGKPDPALLDPEMHWTPQLTLNPVDLPRIAAIQGSRVCERIKRELAPQFAGTVNVFDSIGPSGKLVITLTAKAATKGEALRAACTHLDIDPTQVVAFGDAENDLEMFRIAGASVAMGQAEDAVKAAASYVAAPNHAGGVAEGIQRLLKNGAL